MPTPCRPRAFETAIGRAKRQAVRRICVADHVLARGGLVVDKVVDRAALILIREVLGGSLCDTELVEPLVKMPAWLVE